MFSEETSPSYPDDMSSTCLTQGIVQLLPSYSNLPLPAADVEVTTSNFST